MLLGRVRPPRRERDRDVVPGFLRRLLDGRAPTQNDQVSERDPLPGTLRAVEFLLDLFQFLQHLRQLGRVVHLPILLRRQADSCSVGTAALVGAAEAGRRCPCGRHELRDGEARCEDLAFEGSDVLLPDQFMVDGRDRVLPQLRLRNPRTQVA